MARMSSAVDAEYIERAKREIEQWETQGPGFLVSLGEFIVLPAEQMAKALIPKGIQNTVTTAVQNTMQGLGSVAKLSIDEEEIYYRVETAHEQYDDELKAADSVAKHYWSWNLAYALGEGGAAGAAGFAGLAADIPALLTITLRLIRQLGTCYGYDTTTDLEQEYLMHILRVGSTSNIKAKVEFLIGMKQMERVLVRVSWQKMSEALARKEISRLSLLAVTKQFAQKLGIQLTKRKALQMVPVVGALVGASFNTLFVNDVARAAYMTYRRRRITEMEKPDRDDDDMLLPLDQ